MLPKELKELELNGIVKRTHMAGYHNPQIHHKVSDASIPRQKSNSCKAVAFLM